MRADQKHCLTIGVARMEGKEKTREKYKIYGENIDAYPSKPDENYSVLLSTGILDFFILVSLSCYNHPSLAVIYSTVCSISIVHD